MANRAHNMHICLINSALHPALGHLDRNLDKNPSGGRACVSYRCLKKGENLVSLVFAQRNTILMCIREKKFQCYSGLLFVDGILVSVLEVNAIYMSEFLVSLSTNKICLVATQMRQMQADGTL